MKTQANFSELIGKTIIRIKKDHNVSLTFWCSDKSKYKLSSKDSTFRIIGKLANIHNRKIKEAEFTKTYLSTIFTLADYKFESVLYPIIPENNYCHIYFKGDENINFTKLK